MKNLIQRFIREESGQDLIEYAMLAALISIAAIATLRLIGPNIIAIFQRVQAALV
jgi:pilus assembly protein Flp/PilA